MTEKLRIDVLLVERGFFLTREKARRAILAGKVIVENKRIDKPGTEVDPQAFILVKGEKGYVSRGGEKLEKALKEFKIDLTDVVCLDAGAGTGGFTEVLLKYGARKVYAVDVGYGVLDWRLRQNPMVVVLERTNIRYLEPSKLAELVDMVTADLSFISLKKVIGNLIGLSKRGASFILLIKPQFEAGREKVGKGGLVKEPQVHQEVLFDLCQFFEKEGLVMKNLTYSPITGADGNIEFFVYLKKQDVRPARQTLAGGSQMSDARLVGLINKVVEEAHKTLYG